MAKTRVEDYRRQIEHNIFNGLYIRNIDHSLYSAGREKFVIAATRPKMKGGESRYFFGINADFLEQSQAAILICGNDMIAFKIPADFMKSLGLNYDKKSENLRYLTTIVSDDKVNWYITREAAGSKETKVPINRYLINLKRARRDSEFVKKRECAQ